MVRRILLALTFVAALGVAGLGVSGTASAHGGGCNRSSYYGGYYGGYAPYGYSYGWGGPRYSTYYGGYGGGYGGYGGGYGYPSQSCYRSHSGISFSFGF